MPKFVKKPVVIEAIQFVYEETALVELRKFLGSAMGTWRKDRHLGAKAELQIYTLEDGEKLKVAHIATEGDWIIKGVQGECYPCKPDIFEATYSRVQ